MSITLRSKSGEYRTTQNDIWDIVALRTYGDEHAMHFVQDANFYERFTDAFEGGVVLEIEPLAVTLQNNLKTRKPTPNLAQLLPWLSPPL